MMFARYVVVSLLAVSASGLQAKEVDWIPIAKSMSGTVWKMQIDDLLNKTKIRPKVWVILDHSEDKTVKYRETKSLFLFDCANEKYYSLHSAQYWANGTVKDSWDGSAYKSQYAPPGSMIAPAMNFACPETE